MIHVSVAHYTKGDFGLAAMRCIIVPVRCIYIYTAGRPQRGVDGESTDGSSSVTLQMATHPYRATHLAGT